MKVLSKIVIVAGLPLLLSHFARPLTSITSLESFKPAIATRPPKTSARPTDNAALGSYSKKFEVDIPHGTLTLDQMDDLTKTAENKLKQLSDDRKSKLPLKITEDGLKWEKKWPDSSNSFAYRAVKQHAVDSLEKSIQQEIEAYRALAQGHLKKALDLIAGAAKKQEFVYRTKYLLANSREFIVFHLNFKLWIPSERSQGQKIWQATKNLQKQKKSYHSIPSRKQLRAVIHHFNQLGYPAKENLVGSSLAWDRWLSRFFGKSGLKLYLRVRFKKAVMKVNRYQTKAHQSLDKNDRHNAMKLIKMLRTSRDKASGFQSRYQQNGHSVIDLERYIELSKADRTAEKIPKIRSQQLQNILAKIDDY